jgi:hypothetical protein
MDIKNEDRRKIVNKISESQMRDRIFGEFVMAGQEGAWDEIDKMIKENEEKQNTKGDVR